jgi:hypothetical protein
MVPTPRIIDILYKYLQSKDLKEIRTWDRYRSRIWSSKDWFPYWKPGYWHHPPDILENPCLPINIDID